MPCGTLAAELDYTVPDADLKVVLLDSSKTESFLAVRADTTGRLFVGSREAIFVYEPDPNGGYTPGKEIIRFPKDTWVYDIVVRGDDLYALTVSALYRIPDGRIRREGLKAERLIWGVPLGHVHQCFHGMALGPDDHLYFAMGDPLWYYGDFTRPDHWGHWTFFSRPEGTSTPYTGVGGVFRCRPDGSDFRIVARGLRNSCGLAFDRLWNLFTNDNDHEGLPAGYVPGRLLHVTPHAYFAWPRGWMVAKTPDRADLLETLFAGMGRGVPVGQSYYDETYLPAKYRNSLLVARWGNRALTYYPLVARGASFKVDEAVLLQGRNIARPVGVSVGRGGRVFTTIAYMAQNEGSPTYRSDLVMITRDDDAETHPFDAYDAPTVEPAKLWTELSDPSWWRRNRAHVEIARRGEPMLAEAIDRLATVDADDLARNHLPWLVGMNGSKKAERLLDTVSRGGDAGMRLQAIRALNEYPKLQAARARFVAALDDPSPPVRLAALNALRERTGPVPEEVVEGPARSADTYLRQAATLLLAEQASSTEIEKLCESSDAATRLAGVLAAGSRLTIPPATEPMPDEAPLDPFRSDDVYLIDYADARLDLRKFGRLGLFTVADHWRSRTRTAQQQRLFDLLVERLDDESEAVRLQAAFYLSLLNDPHSEPLVGKVRTDVADRRLPTAPLQSVAKVWLAGPFPDGAGGFETVHPPETGPIELTAEYPVDGGNRSWKEVKRGPRFFDFGVMFGTVDHASYYAYLRLQSARAQRVHLLVGSGDGVKVWHDGALVWENDVERGALPFQDVVHLDLRPGSNDLLVRVRNDVGASGLYLHFRSLAEVVATLPEKLSGSLAERLRAAAAGGVAKVDPAFFEIDWTDAVAKGDPERGRKLFGIDGLKCASCHAVLPDQAGANGPSLGDAAKRFTVAHLVESVLLPSKRVSPVFKATLVALTSGEQLSGLVIGETADRIELLLPDATKRVIPKTEIEATRQQEISPMPNGLVKKPDELRDLLAYLLSKTPVIKRK